MQSEKTQNPTGISQEMAKSTMAKRNKGFWTIDRNMLPYKIHFFLYIGAMGCLLPFHPSIGITRLGLGASNLAVVFTVQQFLFIVLKPFIGYVVDYFNNLKAMIVFLTLLNGILSYLLLVIPPVHNPSMTNWNESHYGLETRFCDLCNYFKELHETSNMFPQKDEIMESSMICEDKNSSTAQNIFLNHCFKINSSLDSVNVTYKIILKSCINITLNTSRVQKNGVSIYPRFQEGHNSIGEIMQRTAASNNIIEIFDNVLYISAMKNHNSIEFLLECPYATNVSKMNINIDFIAKSCYIIPETNIATLDTFLTTSSGYSKEVFCQSPEDIQYQDVTEADSFRTYQFWLFTALLWISCVCTSCIFTLSDTACYENVQDTGGDYGKQRAWGAISWGLMAPFAGFLNDLTGSYLAAMILMTVMCALQIWNLSKMNLAKPQFSQNILKDIKTIFKSSSFLAFELAVLMNGMGIGIVWFFLAWFITDIGGSQLLIGLAHTIQCFLGEVPLMYISGWLIKRIGHFNVVSLSLICHCIRFLGYSYVTNPWYILPLECLDGITFGAFYSAMTSFGKMSSTPGTEATTQSLLCSTYEGLGAGLGCVISGVCFNYYGGHTTFFYAGICFAVATVINVSSTLLLRFRGGFLEVSKVTSCDIARY